MMSTPSCFPAVQVTFLITLCPFNGKIHPLPRRHYSPRSAAPYDISDHQRSSPKP
jgi:hypothetical protein